MKKVLFLFITFTLAITSIVGCNSIVDVVDEPIRTSNDVNLSRLYNSIDSLQSEYLNRNTTRSDWGKWGKRGFFFAVDGVVGLLFAETGPLAGAIGAVGSGLYEDYLDYMVSKGTINRKTCESSTNSDSTVQTVIFPVDNATYIDSIGYYHNLIISEIKSNGKTYINNRGIINYTDYYEDALAIAKSHGIQNNSKINTQLLFQYLESIIKPMAQLEINSEGAVNPDLILSIFFNQAYKNFGFNYSQTMQHQEICLQIIFNYINVEDSQLIEYGTKVNTLIDNSDVDEDTKNNLKTGNNIAINSSLRRR